MRKNKTLEIVVAPKNLKEYISVYREIKTFTDKDKAVPSKLVNAFFSLMQNPHQYELAQAHEEAKNLSKIALEKLKSKKGYQFDWADTVLKEQNVTIKNNTDKIFSEAIAAFLLFKNDHDADKDDAIGFFYMAFEDEYKNRIKSNDQVSFTQYKQAVVSGVLAMAVGFQLTTISNPTNEQIYQATRNAIKNAPNNPKF